MNEEKEFFSEIGWITTSKDLATLKWVRNNISNSDENYYEGPWQFIVASYDGSNPKGLKGWWNRNILGKGRLSIYTERGLINPIWYKRIWKIVTFRNKKGQEVNVTWGITG